MILAFTKHVWGNVWGQTQLVPRRIRGWKAMFFCVLKGALDFVVKG
jgi:hypothetical protein